MITYDGSQIAVVTRKWFDGDEDDEAYEYWLDADGNYCDAYGAGYLHPLVWMPIPELPAWATA